MEHEPARKQKNPRAPRVENDYRVFFVFLTVIISGMCVWTLFEGGDYWEPGRVIPYIALLILQVAAHWNVEKLTAKPPTKILYVIGQSGIAFACVLYSRNLGMLLALYMALIGESIGFLGVKTSGIVAIGYYLIVSFASFLCINGSGDFLSWFISVVPVLIFVCFYVTLYNRQADARERAVKLANELEAANDKLSEYADRVEDLTISNERVRMARELHDTLAQGLTGLTLRLEAADAHLSRNNVEKARSIIMEAMTQARTALSDARSAIDDLRGGIEPDIETAVRREISRFESDAGIPCAFVMGDIQEVDDHVAEAVVKTIAEALANVARHAKASHATVRISSEGTMLTVLISDDGTGFNPASVPPGHYGLIGIRERANLLGGTFMIACDPGNGTSLTLIIPLKKAAS